MKSHSLFGVRAGSGASSRGGRLKLTLLLAGTLSLRALGQVPANALSASGTGDGSTAALLTNVDASTLDAAIHQTESPAADPTISPELGQMPTPGVVSKPPSVPADQAHEFQARLDFARKKRGEKDTTQAAQSLIALLQTNAPDELKRPVLFELALVAQDDNELLKAEQIFSQYLRLYPDDLTAPEILLRQGLVYRQLGVNTLAVSKFYAVMSTALKLKLENMDYYKKLVLQAQIEIADTYYLEGNYGEASDYFSRLLKNPPPDLDQAQIEFKLIRSLSCLTNHVETVARAQVFLEIHAHSADVPEVRFLLATALKNLNRNQESMKQVLLLLQSEQENVQKNPEVWAYWQRRAGNEIAGQFFKEGDNLDALEIYLSLADLDHSPAWQVPVWYQTALVYEQLQQWPKATDLYGRILGRQKELTDPAASPSLLSLFEMAQWRKDYIAWLEKAKTTDQNYQRNAALSLPPTATAH